MLHLGLADTNIFTNVGTVSLANIAADRRIDGGRRRADGVLPLAHWLPAGGSWAGIGHGESRLEDRQRRGSEQDEEARPFDPVAEPDERSRRTVVIRPVTTVFLNSRGLMHAAVRADHCGDPGDRWPEDGSPDRRRAHLAEGHVEPSCDRRYERLFV